MVDVSAHKADLSARLDVIDRILDATHPPSAVLDVSREARGLAVVLLHAAYENLLTTLTSALLEEASRMRVGNKRLQPGFKLFTVANQARSLHDGSLKKMYAQSLPNLIDALDSRARPNTVDPSLFPSDGSFFKRTQVEVWCRIFQVPDPRALMPQIWNEIDGVVSHRNGIAHGRLTPDQVGRAYSEADIRKLVADWRNDWTNFLDTVATLASRREFFRVSR